jgi:hypothetical protein
MLIEVDSKQELLMSLRDNIDNGENNCYAFCDYNFYRDGECGYKVFDSDGNDVGTYDMSDINKNFIKKRIMKKKADIKQIKKTTIKKRGRRKKKGDIIIPEFMEWLHTKECIVLGCHSRNIEAHHVLGRQPRRYDNLCVPLCPEHHRGSEYSWHEGNVKKFRSDYSKELLSDMANKLFTEWMDEESSSSNRYDMDMLRYVSGKIADRTDKIDFAIRGAIFEYENEQDKDSSN